MLIVALRLRFMESRVAGFALAYVTWTSNVKSILWENDYIVLFTVRLKCVSQASSNLCILHVHHSLHVFNQLWSYVNLYIYMVISQTLIFISFFPTIGAALIIYMAISQTLIFSKFFPTIGAALHPQPWRTTFCLAYSTPYLAPRCSATQLRRRHLSSYLAIRSPSKWIISGDFCSAHGLLWEGKL